MRGDDEELIRRLRALDDAVAHHAREQAVEHAQAHGLILIEHAAAAVGFAVHKIRGKRDDRVDAEVDPEKIEERVLFADELCDDIRATRRGVAAEAQAVHKSPHRARDEGGEDGIDALRVVLELSKGRRDGLRLQDKERHRIDDGEDERLGGKAPVDEKEREKAQGHVDDEREVPDGKARLILDHRRDAVEARRRELVLDDKEHVVEGKQDGKDDHDGAVEHGAPHQLFFHMFPHAFFRLYHISRRKSRGIFQIFRPPLPYISQTDEKAEKPRKMLQNMPSNS